MEEKLIEFIKKNDIFYNKRNPQYKDIFLKKRKMEELSREINVPVKKLMFRWKSLRDKFNREIKAMKLPPESGTYIQQKKWKWMDSLMFLSETDYVDENISENFLKTEASCEESIASNLSPQFGEGLSSALTSNSEDMTTSTSEDLFSAPCIDTVEVGEEEKIPIYVHTKTKKDNDSIEDMIIEAKKVMSNLVSLAKETLTEPAVEQPKTLADLFFEGLATQTNEANLSPSRFSELQMEILQCFHKFMYKREVP